MRKLLICVAAAGMSLTVATPAAAQFYGRGYAYNPYGYGRFGMAEGPRAVCSGQRGFALESRLRREQQEGEMDPYTAARIHHAIDQLENQQRHECAEGDLRSIARIDNRYDRIAQWIDTAAHGYRPWER